jgi:hypothetical protein
LIPFAPRTNSTRSVGAHLIPYIDMGMDVHGNAGQHLIAGQVVLSSPGMPCLRCLQFVTDKLLEREAAKYGNAGGNPQVVWPNGVLASTAVGLVLQILTPWHPTPVESAFLEYDGNTATITPSARHAHLIGRPCPHYPDDERGDPGFDVRNIISAKSPPNRYRWARLQALFALMRRRRPGQWLYATVTSVLQRRSNGDGRSAN